MNPEKPSRSKAKKIKVLVVDDSTMMRHLLKDIMETDGSIEVIDTASNGIEALKKIKALRPDVVTLDVEMPKMDGIAALQHIMSEDPLPVIMISAATKLHADLTMKALELGAVDFVPKTSGGLSLDIYKKESFIIEKIKAASKVKNLRPLRLREHPRILDQKKIDLTKPFKVVVIGTSTGGPKAIPEILSRLPSNIPASILIVQHMPKGFTGSFAEHLNWCTSLEVREAGQDDKVLPGKVLIAPGDRHMQVDSSTIKLTEDPEVNFVRPSVDVTMKSVARSFGANSIGVILTGMGSDGAQGMKDIKAAGGRTIAQDPKGCIIPSMPSSAIGLGIVDEVLPLNEIARKILKILEV